jgi:hypothetical protein
MGSEIARIREEIANNYLAAKWGLEGLRYGTAQHPFITSRMERLEEHRQQLNALVGEETGIHLFAEMLDRLPAHPIRSSLQDVLRHELGKTEEVEILIDHLQEAWETLDLLIERFGRPNALKILTAPLATTDAVPS